MKKRKWILIGTVGLVVLIFAAFGFLRVSKTLIASHRMVTVPSASMEPTIPSGSVQRLDMTAYQTTPPKVGEVIGFSPPAIALLPNQKDAIFLSRCVGIGGDVIEIRSGTLFRNGALVKEDYVHNKPTSDFKLVRFRGKLLPLSYDGTFANLANMGTAPPFQLESTEDMEAAMKLPASPIPPGSIVVMGDNRTGAFDSRYWGVLPLSQVLGKVILSK